MEPAAETGSTRGNRLVPPVRPSPIGERVTGAIEYRSRKDRQQLTAYGCTKEDLRKNQNNLVNHDQRLRVRGEVCRCPEPDRARGKFEGATSMGQGFRIVQRPAIVWIVVALLVAGWSGVGKAQSESDLYCAIEVEPGLVSAECYGETTEGFDVGHDLPG